MHSSFGSIPNEPETASGRLVTKLVASMLLKASVPSKDINTLLLTFPLSCTVFFGSSTLQSDDNTCCRPHAQRWRAQENDEQRQKEAKRSVFIVIEVQLAAKVKLVG